MHRIVVSTTANMWIPWILYCAHESSKLNSRRQQIGSSRLFMSASRHEQKPTEGDLNKKNGKNNFEFLSRVTPKTVQSDPKVLPTSSPK